MNPVAYLDQLAALQAAAWPAAVPRSATYPHGQQPLSEYLRAWARLQPDSVALDFYGHSLSYAELDQQSDRCAALLAELGVRPGDRVAVFMPNCPQLHITFYAILKCGAVYVPLDVNAPVERQAFIVQDSGAHRVLTNLADLNLDPAAPQTDETDDWPADRAGLATGGVALA